MNRARILVTLVVLSLAACAGPGKPPPQAGGIVTLGKASYYAARFHGRKTANGERFDMHKMTAAHRTLPFGSRVRVTNLKNGKNVVVRINDRGPFGDKKRIIDLSLAAAKKLDMVKSGVIPVRVLLLALPKTHQ